MDTEIDNIIANLKVVDVHIKNKIHLWSGTIYKA